MYKQVETQNKNRSKAAGNVVGLKKTNTTSPFQFIDKRSEFVAQKKAQELASGIEKSGASKHIAQRQVLTVGAVDAEVEIAQEYLMKTMGTGINAFLNVGSLNSAEPEVLVGHGTSGKLGEMDEHEFSNKLEEKINKDNVYDIRLVACNTGKNNEEGGSLASKVHSILKGNGYKTKITAPKDLVFVLGENKIVTGNPFTKEVNKKAEDMAIKSKTFEKALADVIDELVEELDGSLAKKWENIDEAMKEDISTLKGKGVKKAKQLPKRDESAIDFFKSVLLDVNNNAQGKKFDPVIKKLIKVIYDLRTYKTLVNGMTYAEYERMLEKRFMRNYLYPTAYIEHPSGTSRYNIVPDEENLNWSSHS